MHGSFSLATSGEPLLDGFRVLYGNAAAKMLAFLAVIGLIASFHTIIYAYGRQIYSLARAGYYLPFMSLTNGKKVPHMALYRRHDPGLPHHADRVVRRCRRTNAVRSSAAPCSTWRCSAR